MKEIKEPEFNPDKEMLNACLVNGKKLKMKMKVNNEDNDNPLWEAEIYCE